MKLVMGKVAPDAYSKVNNNQAKVLMISSPYPYRTVVCNRDTIRYHTLCRLVTYEEYCNICTELRCICIDIGERYSPEHSYSVTLEYIQNYILNQNIYKYNILGDYFSNPNMVRLDYDKLVGRIPEDRCITYDGYWDCLLEIA